MYLRSFNIFKVSAVSTFIFITIFYAQSVLASAVNNNGIYLNSESGRVNIRVGGFIQGDGSYANGEARNQGFNNGYNTRRARVYLKADILDNWGAVVMYDFVNGGDWKALFANYTGFKNTEIRIGQFKPAYDMIGVAP